MKIINSSKLILAFIFLLTINLSSQVFRGYYSDGIVKYNSPEDHKRYTINGYYNDGKLEFKASYKRDDLNGITYEYYRDGTLKAEINFRNDRRNGLARFYYEDASMMAKIVYKRGKETGIAKYYTKKGELKPSIIDLKKITRRIKRYEERLIDDD